jgi:hypothetical protein
MMTLLTTDEQQRLAAALRPGEQLLWQGKGGVNSRPAPGFLALLFRKSSSMGSSAVLYAITSRRVLAMLPEGDEQEWFLMLGLVQAVNEAPGGSGDIVFDYQEVNGRKEPRGLIGIPAVAEVRNLLNSAIDAAYNASPWSV